MQKFKIPGWPESLTPPVPGLSGTSADQPFDPFSGGFDLLKNFWGGMQSGLPGFVVPTVDTNELEKQIKDLKAVEGWLNVNLNLLRTTIQSLEVQRNTIMTLRSFGGSVDQAMAELLRQGAAGTQSAPPDSGSDTGPAAARVSASKLPPGWPTAQTGTTGSGVPRTARSAAAPDSSGSARSSRKRAATADTTTEPAAATFASATAAPTAAWVDFLQEQFKRIAQASLADQPASSADTAKPAAQSVAPDTTGAATSKVRGATGATSASSAASSKPSRKRPRTPRRAAP